MREGPRPLRQGRKAGLGRGISRSQSRGPRFPGSGGCGRLGSLLSSASFPWMWTPPEVPLAPGLPPGNWLTRLAVFEPLGLQRQRPSLSQNKAEQDCYTNWLVGP